VYQHSIFPKHLTIIGMGLLGSSLARAIKHAHPQMCITSCNREQATGHRALELGFANFATSNPEEAVGKADMVMISTPLSAYEQIIPRIAPHLKEGAVVTDMGSVKGKVAGWFKQYLSEAHYPLSVPGHPIAGSEKSGIEAGSEDMFKGKKVILTPTIYTRREAVDRVSSLWGAAGAHVQEMDADIHDNIYAYVSHAVQFIISTAMTSVPCNNALFRESPSYRLFWRIAGSDPQMWEDICRTNHLAINRALKAFILRMESFIHLLKDERYGTVRLLIQQSQMVRERLPHGTEVIPSFIEHSTLFAESVACTLLASVSVHELHYAGSGFRDVTQIIMQAPLPSNMQIQEKKPELVDILEDFIAACKITQQQIERNTSDELRTLLENAQNTYQSLSV
jgi:prephenate dehydrogenase